MSKWNRPTDILEEARKGAGRIGIVERVQDVDPDFIPSAPTGVALAIQIREMKTKVEYRAIASSNASTPAQCQADISNYVFQIRPTNAGGTPQDGNNVRTRLITRKDAADMTTVHAVFGNLENPRKWYWQTRARIIDNDFRLGDWSAWTTPQLASVDSNAQPPVPTGVALVYDRVEKDRYNRYRAIITWTPVTGWDIPGGDDAADIDRYVVQMVMTDSAGNITDTKPQKDQIEHEGGSQHICRFFPVKKGQYWKARVKAVDKFNRSGDWTAYTAHAAVSDTTPPAIPINVQAEGVFNHIVMDWDAPLQADGETPDEDIVYFQVQTAKGSAFNTIIRWDKYVLQTRRIFPAKDYKQKFWLRVRSVDAAGNKSAWVTAGPVYPQRATAARTVVASTPSPSEIVWQNEDGYDLAGAGTNRAYQTSLSQLHAQAHVQAGAGAATGRVQALIQLSDTLNRANVGLTLFRIDANNFMWARMRMASAINVIEIGKFDTAAATTLSTASAQGLEHGGTYLFEARLSSTQIAVYLNGVLKLTYTMTAGEQTKYNAANRMGLYLSADGTNDDCRSRFDYFKVLDNAGTDILTEDDFDRVPSSTVIGVSDTNDTWVQDRGLWGISDEGVAQTLIGYATAQPMFNASDATARSVTIPVPSTYKKMGEAGQDASPLTITIDRPTRFFCWATANCMNESGVEEYSIRFYIDIVVGIVEDVGRYSQQQCGLDDAASSRRRFVSNVRDLYVDASSTVTREVEFWWAYQKGGANARPCTITNQKMTVFAAYAPDFTPPAGQPPRVQWTTWAKTLNRYRRLEGSD